MSEDSLKKFYRSVEMMTGMSIEEIQNTPIDELRAREEKKRGKPLKFSSGLLLGASTDCDGSCSGLSLIGQRFVSHEECEQAYRQAIRTPWYERGNVIG